MTAISSRLCSAEKSHEDVPTIVRTIGKGGTGWVLRTTKRRRRRGLLVVCLLRLLMAVLGRLRNWRVCTRSLYTAFLFLSPFTSLFDFFLFWFLPPPPRPPSRLSLLLFSRDDDVSFLFPSSRLTCHPLRMFSQAR